MNSMKSTLSIGEFSRITHISIKTLRHYHEVGLLEPADIDENTGYRHYLVDQIPTAQVIRRFRSLNMPINQISQVLLAPEVDVRTALITQHLSRLEGELEQTRSQVSALKELLGPMRGPAQIERRNVQATPAVGIQEMVDLSDLLSWYHGALGELRATVAAQGLHPSGVGGGMFSSELFQYERGEASVFVPVDSSVRPVGRVTSLVIPAVELAIIVHEGKHDNIDVTYGELGKYVSEHELAVEGPVREYYPIDVTTTPDYSKWRTEIGWPIFQTTK